MKKRIVGLMLLAVVAALVLGACKSGGSNAPKVDWEVKVTGAVSKPLTLTYADLAKRPQTTLKDVEMIRSGGESTKNAWTGPALADILKDAGISANAAGVTCVASDGYAMEMTMEDIDRAIIALKMDDKWLNTDSKGPLRLVAPDKTANFWIAMLTEIEVTE